MPPTRPGPEPTEHDPQLTAYLLDLMEIGAKVARNIGRQAEGNEEPPATDLADQFERVSRAMRRTALLIRHVAQGANATPRRTQARKRIIRDVEDAIQRDPRDPAPLQAEFIDRLDSPDLEEEIATRPVEDIILDIRRDLGLENMLGNHPWERRTPRDIETLRQRAAAPTPAAYTPGQHPADLKHPGQPRPRPHPRPHDPDDEQQLIALAKLLSSA